MLALLSLPIFRRPRVQPYLPPPRLEEVALPALPPPRSGAFLALAAVERASAEDLLAVILWRQDYPGCGSWGFYEATPAEQQPFIERARRIIAEYHAMQAEARDWAHPLAANAAWIEHYFRAEVLAVIFWRLDYPGRGSWGYIKATQAERQGCLDRANIVVEEYRAIQTEARQWAA